MTREQYHYFRRRLYFNRQAAWSEMFAGERHIMGAVQAMRMPCIDKLAVRQSRAYTFAKYGMKGAPSHLMNEFAFAGKVDFRKGV